MFLYLCILVCLATLSITAFTVAIAVELLSFLCGLRRRFRSSPTLLFTICALPFIMSTALTLAFVLPSFLVLEPRSTSETPESLLLVLGLVGGLLIAAVVMRLTRSILMTRALVRQWLRTSRLLKLGAQVPVHVVDRPESLVAVAGILRPRVFIGQRALEVLAGTELRAAIAHEIGHMRALDNLKHLVLTATRPPRFFRQFAALESNWRASVEAAADRRALDSGVSACELGAALVKIGRIGARSGPLSPGMSYLLSSCRQSGLDLRIGNLEKILMEGHSTPRTTATRRARIWFALALITLYLCWLPLWLDATHQAIEWLVR